MKTQPVKAGEIIRHKGRLCEIIGYATDKVVFMRVLRDEDKDKCPHCEKPIPTDIDEVENCLNWQENVEPVETINPLT